MTKEQIYDIVWKLADDHIKKYNPCKFKDGKCFGGRVNGCCGCGFKKSIRNPEKRVCQYLDEYKGCTIQALGCKLHLCPDPTHSAYCLSEEEPHKSMSAEEQRTWDGVLYYLLALRRFALELGLHVDCWIPKEETLRLSQGKSFDREE